MLTLQSDITVGNLRFKTASSVRITKTWKQLTDTARIEFPRNLKLKNKSLKERVQVGQKVTIQLGYKPDLQEEFRGYVTNVSPTEPFVIECQDEMWKLKQTNISQQFEATTLPDMLSQILPGDLETNIKQVELGPYRINNASIAKVLRNVKDNYGIQSFFRGNTLVVGFPYPDEPEQVNYHMQKNVANDRLEYRTEDDAKIKVEAISIQPDNTKESVTVGDDEGELRTLHFYNISKGELKSRAEDKLSELKVAGYDGSFTAFGIPYVQHGYQVNLKDRRYPEREGSYMVDRVVTTFGSNGFRREVELGKQVS